MKRPLFLTQFILLVCLLVVVPTSNAKTEFSNCLHEPENSRAGLKAYTGGRSVSDWAFGNEKECLNRLGLTIDGKSTKLNPSASIFGETLDQFYNCPDFVESGKFSHIEELRNASSLLARDLLVDGMWQEVAFRSRFQLLCRESTLDIYKSDAAKQNNVNAKAKAKFDDVKADIRKLIRRKARALKKAQKEVANRVSCDKSNILQRKVCSDIANAQAARDKENIEAKIAAKLSLIPFGYEPKVANAILEMAAYNTFNEKTYKDSLLATQKNYNDEAKYWDGKVKPAPSGGENYCITEEFKLKSSRGTWSQMDEYLNNLPESRLSPTQRMAVQCYIRSHYNRVPENKTMARQLTMGVVAGGAVLATGGSSIPALGVLGLDAVLFIDQLERAYKACTAEEFTVSSAKTSCDAEKAFSRETEQSEPTKCGPEAAWAAVGAIPLAGAVLGPIGKATNNIIVKGRANSKASQVNETKLLTYQPKTARKEQAAKKLEQAAKGINSETVIHAYHQRAGVPGAAGYTAAQIKAMGAIGKFDQYHIEKIRSVGEEKIITVKLKAGNKWDDIAPRGVEALAGDPRNITNYLGEKFGFKKINEITMEMPDAKTLTSRIKAYNAKQTDPNLKIPVSFYEVNGVIPDKLYVQRYVKDGELPLGRTGFSDNGHIYFHDLTVHGVATVLPPAAINSQRKGYELIEQFRDFVTKNHPDKLKGISDSMDKIYHRASFFIDNVTAGSSRSIGDMSPWEHFTNVSGSVNDLDLIKAFKETLPESIDTMPRPVSYDRSYSPHDLLNRSKKWYADRRKELSRAISNTDF